MSAMSLPKLTPRLVVPDAGAAIDFYTQVFGAHEIERYATPAGRVVHAAISIDDAILSLVDEEPDQNNESPQRLGGSAVILTLLVDDPDAVAARAVELGAEIVFEVADQFYGHREGRFVDPFGHLWIVTRVTAELTPEQIQEGVDSFEDC